MSVLLCLFKISENTKNEHMKIESDDNTSIAATISIIAIGIMLVASHGCYQVEQTKREAIKAGLVEKPTGTTGTAWSKPE